MLEIFPTRILKASMPNYNREETIALIEPFFAQVDSKNATGIQLSGTGNDISTSTNGLLYLHKEKSIAHITEFIKQQVEVYWRESKFLNLPEIQYMWANKYFKNGFAAMHNHSPHILTGVFYISMENDDQGRIVFQDPNEAILCTQPQCHEDRVAQNSYSLSIRSGDILVFPSWLKHYTQPNKTDDPKISMAFDINFKGMELMRKLAATL